MADRKARYERRQASRSRRDDQSKKALASNFRATLIKIGAGGVVLAVIVVGAVFFLGSRDILPPTGFGPNHSESLPTRQINTVPIPRPIQEHVMEHIGDGNPPGVLVQYNCQDYTCGPDLIQQLTDIVSSYPPSVFLAPYPGMSAKIALAAPGELETLDEVDVDAINTFIRSNLRS